jgi:malonyl-CoA decarboxylase
MKPERSTSFFGELLNSLTERGRALLRGRNGHELPKLSRDELINLGETLLSRRGEVTGTALAQALLDGYAAATPANRVAFLTALAESFGADRGRIEKAVEALQRDGFDGEAVARVHAAAEPRRQELIRRLNQAPGGTAALIRMRETVLDNLKDHPQLKPVDGDFVHLLASWFNRSFLVLRRIDWTTPAHILEKIIRYEAVHEIKNWDDLRNRLASPDRRCYGFFHPQLTDEPLIFVEVALTEEIPGAIAPLLALDRTPIRAADATTAVFYSISNTQRGLGGISFGNFLIKQVVEELKRELPNLDTFVTLSPAPDFARWLNAERTSETPAVVTADMKQVLAVLDQPGWHQDPETAEAAREVMLPLVAYYFLRGRDSRGRVFDSVARFHLGNGARLEQLDFLGDTSEKGMQQAFGLMVNYLYDLDEIEQNHEAFLEKGIVAASPAVRKLVKAKAAGLAAG